MSSSPTNINLRPNEELVFVKPASSKGKGIAAIFTSPNALFHDDFHAKGYAPPTHQLVIIAHGNGGHKNYCYQSILAEKLLSEMGIYSVRFDFRGCGDSEPNADANVGRVIEQDIEDIDAIAKYAVSGLYKDTKFNISGIVAHSRGSAAMFLWAVKQHKLFVNGSTSDSSAILVPNLVNCGGRFDYSNHLKRIKDSYPNWEQEKCYKLESIYRDGEYKSVIIPRNETLSLSGIDLSDSAELEASVLSIYGLDDTAVPLEDAASFANLFSGKHHLRFVKNADHNYYGTKATPGLEVPQNSKGKYNYNYVVKDIILEFFSHPKELDRFYNRSKNLSSIPRWKDIEGIPNFRDIGGWRISSEEYVRPNFGFRCALPSGVTEKGKKSLVEMNVKAVFDFRSDHERKRDGLLQVEGIETIHCPVMKEKKDAGPQDLMLQYKNLIVSWATYKDIYREMLTDGVGAFKTVLEFVRDHPSEGFLFHCSAGKDRTGMMAMLIFLICGLDNTTIAREYELTTIGLRPLYPKMKDEFLHGMAKFGEKAKLFEAKFALGRPGWTLEKDGFANIVSSRCEAMLATLDLFNKEFGGIKNYLHKMGFTDTDIATIRSNLVIRRSAL